MASDLNYSGIKLVNFDEKDYLVKLLLEHKEGNKYLEMNNLNNKKENKQMGAGNQEKLDI